MNQDRNNQKNFRSGTGARNGNGNRNFGFRRNNFSNSPREMHKAICSECKKECTVPFKPTEGKPVYCRECFSKKQ